PAQCLPSRRCYAGADIRRVWYLSEQHRNWCKYFQTELEQIELRNIANDHNQGRSVMLSRRTVLDLLACSALVTAAGAEPAKKKARVRQEAPTQERTQPSWS